MTEIKNAATVVLIRQNEVGYFILMGKRKPTAAFMPSKYVFPGGGWEEQDNLVPVASRINCHQKELLNLETDFVESSNLGITAIRELWEETGLRLSSKGKFNSFPSNWREFFSEDQVPDVSNLQFFFRAITPPGRTRRFDARFFFCDARYIYNDLDDFNNASGELIFLRWVEISQAKNLELPTITRIVIEHLTTLIKSNFIYDFIPFYSGDSDGLKKRKLRF